MHSCPDCGQACYCDGEDYENDYALVDGCSHNCDDVDRDDLDRDDDAFERDAFLEVQP